MRVRSYGFATLALGILIGAGGCSSDSPTSPLVPARPAAEKGGYLGTGSRQEGATTSTTTSSGGYLGTGSREAAAPSTSAASASGGYLGTGS